MRESSRSNRRPEFRLEERMRRTWILALAAVAAVACTAASAAGPEAVRVNTFPNAKALPFHAGLAQGIFARHGVALLLSFTENSSRQREGLAAGRFDVAHAAVDNAVAMVDTAGDRKSVV